MNQNLELGDSWGVLSEHNSDSEIEAMENFNKQPSLASFNDSDEMYNSLIKNYRQRHSFVSLPSMPNQSNSSNEMIHTLIRTNSFEKQQTTPVARNVVIESGSIQVHSRNFLYDREVSQLIYDNEPTLIVDCRWPYEYMSGCVRNAVNLYSFNNLHQYLVNNKVDKDTQIVFYCEFSQRRSRKMLNWLYDEGKYRNLHLMLGGFSNFYLQQPTFVAGNYRQEADLNFESQMEYYSQGKTYQMGINNVFEEKQLKNQSLPF